jgi:beta-xylosidase
MRRNSIKINGWLLGFAFTTVFLLGTKVYGQHNPVIEGWYADPEGIKYGNTYWIYPTYSAPYKDQVFMDAFSSADLKTWKKHPRIIDTSTVKWAKKAMWAPAVMKKGNKYYLFFGANDIHPGEVGASVLLWPVSPMAPTKIY